MAATKKKQQETTTPQVEARIDRLIDIALAGVAADGAAVEGGEGGLAVDGGGLGGLGDILEQLLHKVHSSCK